MSSKATPSAGPEGKYLFIHGPRIAYGGSRAPSHRAMKDLHWFLKSPGNNVQVVGNESTHRRWLCYISSEDTASSGAKQRNLIVISGDVNKTALVVRERILPFGVQTLAEAPGGPYNRSFLKLADVMKALEDSKFPADVVLCTDYASTAIKDLTLTCLTGAKSYLPDHVIAKLPRHLLQRLDPDAAPAGKLDGSTILESYLLDGLARDDAWPETFRHGTESITFANKLDSLLDEKTGKFTEAARTAAVDVFAGRKDRAFVEQLMRDIQSQIKQVPHAKQPSIEGITRYWQPNDETARPGWYLVHAVYDALTAPTAKSANTTSVMAE